MTAALTAALVVLVSSFGCAALRWLRVAQREHYLPGEVSRFAVRWWRSSIANEALYLVAVTCCGVSFWKPLGALGVGVIGTIAPIGLAIKGRTSRLSWTRRLRMLATVVVVFVAVVVVLSGTIGNLADSVVAIGVLVLLAPVVIDIALLAVSPAENRFANRYVLQASQRLARLRPVVVAITGSYGKTTTKGYVAHLLAPSHVVVASPRSFNNRAGLARTVNESLVPGTEILIAEMGAYGPGEIRDLCSWLTPSIAVITAIGPVHLERFKDLSVTLASKAEIAEQAEVVVVNVDDERLATLVDRFREQGKRVVTCSANDVGADVLIRDGNDGLGLWLGGKEIGNCFVDPDRRPSALTNVACAIGVGIALGDDPFAMLAMLDSLPQAANRLVAQKSTTGAIILDDTFNSNPAGAGLALKLLARTGSAGNRRVLVTPGMIELGAVQYTENKKFVEQASLFCSDIVIVGQTNRAALRGGIGASVHVVQVRTREDAANWVRENLRAGDVVLYENDLPDHYA